ncbi:DUF86 domain-containing protein [Salsuginibacillus kocurii]|uniref:DUF86 domain-containing protein n=1 Tax=Salsuginibacillus kocurii TaxID=427078 RepID=UPI00037A43E8|nr:DUF86 domain-containing protein [Salsuginibacillus kocurii]
MYFVDRTQLENLLSYMEATLTQLEELKEQKSAIEQLALERIGHMTIETIIDVGNHMIDGFIMRDPGSYDDIIDILEDEKVISSSDERSLKEIILWRKPLIQDYTAVDHKKLYNDLAANVKVLLQFPQKVRTYLDEQLGPVSAFLPAEENRSNDKQ